MVEPIRGDSSVEADDQFDQIVDEILESQRTGGKPDLAEFERRYPNYGAQLREIFDTLLMAERLDVKTAAPLRPEVPATEDKLEEFPSRLGDFELISELGRGGMGVVFAARQISLNRVVALKLLSRHLAANKRFAERFQREARSAAGLQHPNIVAVYGNGFEQGIYHYAMQLIEGQNLTDVMEEVKHLVSARSSNKQIVRGFNDLSRRLLESDMSAASSEANSPRASSGTLVGMDLSSTQIGNPAVGVDRSGEKRGSYFKNIAALARDISHALDYAHQRRTIHRDIKPSNLILDRQGKIWITDFGLAKLESDEALTAAGDVLGTMRYVAPEQLDGVSAPSCDIYGVGVTLYEMATLQPAWTADNHAQLLTRVRSDSVIRPRAIDPSIPRDLETIILKAMERVPTERYRSARELADDLNRFCNDQPIKARKPSAAENVWRWSRRNRLAAASLMVVLFVLAVVIPTISTTYSFVLRGQVAKSQAAERQATVANGKFQVKLVESLILQARAQRSMASLRARENAISPLIEANGLLQSTELSEEKRRELQRDLRDEAIAAIALPDFKDELRFQPNLKDGQRLKLHDASGDLIALLREMPDGSATTEVAHRDDHNSPLVSIPIRADLARIDRLQTRLLTHSNYQSSDAKMDCCVWNIADGKKIWEARIPPYQGHFTPTDDAVVGLDENGRPFRFYLVERVEKRGAVVCNPNYLVAMRTNPSADTVALIFPDHLEIRNFADGKIIARIRQPRRDAQFEQGHWSPRDDWFAAKSTDGTITLYDPSDWKVQRTLAADAALGTHLTASPDGRYLETKTWSNRLQVFDVMTGKQILGFRSQVDGQFVNLSDYLVGPVSDKIDWRMFRLVPSDVYRLHGVTPDSLMRIGYSAISESTQGNIVASKLASGRLAFINLDDSRHLITDAAIDFPDFDSEGNLWGLQNGSVIKWRAADNGGVVSYSNPVQVRQINSSCFAIDPSGQLMAWNLNEGVAVANLAASADQVQILKPSGDVRRIVVSPDRKWIVGPQHNLTGCFVFDLNSNASWDLSPQSRLTIPQFNADGSLMALTVPGDSLRLYRSGEWDKPLRTWGSAFGRPAFSPDGRILAACFEPGSITLIDLVGGSPEMRLIQPDETSANWLAFTADGTRLVFASGESNCLHEWNLVALRDELQALKIDASILPQRATPIVSAPRTRSDKDSAWVKFMPEKEKERKLLQKWTVVSATKDRAKIVECLEELHQVAPENSRYANLLAWTLIQNRNATPAERGRALELARLALAQDNSQANVHNTLGVVFYRLGELEEAVSTLGTARGLRGNNDTSFDDYFLTMAYARVGQIQPACEAWVRGLRSQLKSNALDEERRSVCLESAFVLTGALAAQLRFN